VSSVTCNNNMGGTIGVAVLALIAVLFIKEKALLTTSGAERRADEEAEMLDE